VLQSRDFYPEFADALKNEIGVDIELDRSGTLCLGFGEDDVAEIRRRFEWQRSARLSVEALSAAECRSLEPAISEWVIEGLFFSE
jgi:glycine oxidase